jgi:hypothetical protein
MRMSIQPHANPEMYQSRELRVASRLSLLRQLNEARSNNSPELEKLEQLLATSDERARGRLSIQPRS